jgi:hypothetical protein
LCFVGLQFIFFCDIIQSERGKENPKNRKGKKKMTANEIKEKIARVEYAIFLEQMADFMNWSKYYELQQKKEALQAELKKMGE